MQTRSLTESRRAGPSHLSEGSVEMVCGCLLWAGISCACEPGEEDSYAGSVARQISGNLSRPVSWKKKMVSGALATAENDGFAVCGWERVMAQ